VETAAEVGWEDYKDVANLIVSTFSTTRLFHGYSFNSWSDQVTYNRAFLADWLDSPQTSLYYALQVAPDTQAKDDALGVLDEEFHGLYDFLSPSVCSLDASECQSCSE
jgi:hypothetical protein